MSRPTQVYAHEFDARLMALPVTMRNRIEAAITELGLRLETFPHHRLKGSDCFRLRVGDYRVIYQFNIEQGLLQLITLGHRREIYR
jgi:mRNA interferase RelE/StbE